MTLLRVYANELGLSREEVLEMENCHLRIRTIEDFLFTDINAFRRFCNLNDTNLNKAKKEFFKLYTGKLKRLSPENLITYYLPVGTKKLNDFLDGGLPINKVTELRGDPMSGKTLFCLNIVLDLLRIGKRLLYVDTDYGMCSTLFFDLLQEQVGDEQEISELMKRMDVCFVNNYQELVWRLDRLYLSQRDGRSDYNFLVIDSIVSPLAVECLSLKTIGGLQETHEKVNLFISLITKLLTASLTILTTNISKSNPLPNSWTNRCDLILELTKAEHPNSSCTFHLSTKKPFRCLSSLSCRNVLNRVLSENSQSSSSNSTQQLNGNGDQHSNLSLNSMSRGFPSDSRYSSARLNLTDSVNERNSHSGIGAGLYQSNRPTGGDMSDLLECSLDEMGDDEFDRLNEIDSSPFAVTNAVLSYTLSERGAINFLD